MLSSPSPSPNGSRSAIRPRNLPSSSSGYAGDTTRRLAAQTRQKSKPIRQQSIVRVRSGGVNLLWSAGGPARLQFMRFNHLGLPVRDERRSRQFYSAYFGFDPASAQEYPDGTVVIRNADGFDLALRPAEHIQPPPVFLHSGFRAAEPQDVRALMERMEADGITIVERDDEAARTAFKCLDPDGHRIEVYWERFSPGNGKAETVLSEAAQTRHPRYRVPASRYPWLTRRLRGSREPEAAALSAADERVLAGRLRNCAERSRAERPGCWTTASAPETGS
jgi:catechol 2,3-dioxygenase-like lactoylglutathione lyase family enzyme